MVGGISLEILIIGGPKSHGTIQVQLQRLLLIQEHIVVKAHIHHPAAKVLCHHYCIVLGRVNKRHRGICSVPERTKHPHPQRGKIHHIRGGIDHEIHRIAVHIFYGDKNHTAVRSAVSDPGGHHVNDRALHLGESVLSNRRPSVSIIEVHIFSLLYPIIKLELVRIIYAPLYKIVPPPITYSPS